MNDKPVAPAADPPSFSVAPTSQALPNPIAPVAVTLSWNVPNATAVIIDAPGLDGVQQPAGSIALAVEETTTWTLTAFDATVGKLTVLTATVTITPDRAQRVVPENLIALWPADSPPAGWVLCTKDEHTNNDVVPDLTDRFIIGANGNVNTTGEATQHAHSAPAFAEISARTEPAGAHTHDMPSDWEEYGLSSGGENCILLPGSYDGHKTTGQSNPQTHTHAFEMSIDAGTTGPDVGTSDGEPILPPWYALYYIMKRNDA